MNCPEAEHVIWASLYVYNDGSRTSRVNIIIADWQTVIIILPGFGPLVRDSDRSDEWESLFIKIQTGGAAKRRWF